MKKLLILLILPVLSFGQINNSIQFENKAPTVEYNKIGCQDLDDVFMDVLSYFDINIPLIGLIGCSQIIPILESIPNTLIDCETDLTPLDIIDFIDLTIADICECSCEEHLELEDQNAKKNLIKVINVLGGAANNKGLQLEIYDDGSVEKKYLIK